LTLTGERLKHALKPYTNCWKRAALIIGRALAGIPIVPKSEDLPSGVVGSLGDALGGCGVDYYLLVGNVIPPLIRYLTYTHDSTEAFVDKYDETVGEVRRVRDTVRGRGGIYGAEGLYGLGLASIIAKAVESGKPVGPSDADAALYIASFAIQRVASPDLIMPILSALRPLRDKAPHRYLKLLVSALSIENLDSGTVRYIFDGLNEVLDKYGDVVRGYAWSLVHAIIAYTNLLSRYFVYFSSGGIENIVGRVVDFLNELGRFSPSLGVIAWAHALDPALEHEYLRELMERALRIKVVDKAGEVLEELGRLRGRVQELMRDEEFMGYVESKYIKADEETVRKEILDEASHLKHALAIYRLYNDELNEAEELFNEAADESREIGDYENYLTARSWALRVEAIKGSLVDDDLVRLVDRFRQLYEETFNEERFKPTALYLSIAPSILGNYLVSLALTGDYEMINELLEEHLLVLNADRRASVLTRLALNALLRPRGGLSGELGGKLSVNPEELINAFEPYMRSEFLPALMVAFGVIKKPEDGAAVCISLDDLIEGMDCMHAISVAMNDNAAVVQFSGRLIDTFRGLLFEKPGLLKELGVNADKLTDEFKGLADGLDGKSLAQLIAPTNSMARLALMLRALINGDERLAKAYALIGTVDFGGKLPTRLFLEAYKAWCDLGKDEFRRAIAKLFFFHV
jgi:hypothetical protein